MAITGFDETAQPRAGTQESGDVKRTGVAANRQGESPRPVQELGPKPKAVLMVMDEEPAFRSLPRAIHGWRGGLELPVGEG